jgi:hypothetical protein
VYRFIGIFQAIKSLIIYCFITRIIKALFLFYLFNPFLRHMFTILSRWLSSLENSVKLQWDPGIAFVYQQGVQKNCNAKNMLPSENYLQIWEIDIIFITFLPP